MVAEVACVQLVCWLLVGGVDIEVNDTVIVTFATGYTAESGKLLELATGSDKKFCLSSNSR